MKLEQTERSEMLEYKIQTHTYLSMKLEQTERSEMLAYKIQTHTYPSMKMEQTVFRNVSI